MISELDGMTSLPLAITAPRNILHSGISHNGSKEDSGGSEECSKESEECSLQDDEYYKENDECSHKRRDRNKYFTSESKTLSAIPNSIDFENSPLKLSTSPSPSVYSEIPSGAIMRTQVYHTSPTSSTSTSCSTEYTHILDDSDSESDRKFLLQKESFYHSHHDPDQSGCTEVYVTSKEKLPLRSDDSQSIQRRNNLMASSTSTSSCSGSKISDIFDEFQNDGEDSLELEWMSSNVEVEVEVEVGGKKKEKERVENIYDDLRRTLEEGEEEEGGDEEEEEGGDEEEDGEEEEEEEEEDTVIRFTNGKQRDDIEMLRKDRNTLNSRGTIKNDVIEISKNQRSAFHDDTETEEFLPQRRRIVRKFKEKQR